MKTSGTRWGPSQTEIERADKVVIVPKRAKRERWTDDTAQRWAREDVLCGGPPEKPIDPETGETINWSEVKNLAGRRVRIRARPMGLIIPTTDGSKRYYPGDAAPSSGTTGFALGTSVEQMRSQARIEGELRRFAKRLLNEYNKVETKRIRDQERRPATREFWEVGKEVREFLARTPETTQDQVWFTLEQWGRGAGGYGKRWLEYATYFYDWRGSAAMDDPVFGLSETRVMNILQAAKESGPRDRLADECIRGVFQGFSDEEFKWATGQSPATFPLSEDEFREFRAFGHRVARGDTLTSKDLGRLRAHLERLRG